MNNEQVFKTFTALSFDGEVVTGADSVSPSGSQPRLTPEAGLPDVTAEFDESLELLHQRYTAPFIVAALHRHEAQ